MDAGSREGPERGAVGFVISEGRGEIKRSRVDPGMDHRKVAVDRNNGDRRLRPGHDRPPLIRDAHVRNVREQVVKRVDAVRDHRGT